MNCDICCFNLIESIGITLDNSTGVVKIEIPENTFVEDERFLLVLRQDLPTTGSAPIQIISGETSIYTYNRIGNALRADQIANTRKLNAVYGVDPAHILIFNHLPDSAVAKEAK